MKENSNDSKVLPGLYKGCTVMHRNEHDYSGEPEQAHQVDPEGDDGRDCAIRRDCPEEIPFGVGGFHRHGAVAEQFEATPSGQTEGDDAMSAQVESGLYPPRMLREARTEVAGLRRLLARMVGHIDGTKPDDHAVRMARAYVAGLRDADPALVAPKSNKEVFGDDDLPF